MSPQKKGKNLITQSDNFVRIIIKGVTFAPCDVLAIWFPDIVLENQKFHNGSEKCKKKKKRKWKMSSTEIKSNETKISQNILQGTISIFLYCIPIPYHKFIPQGRNREN